MDLNLIEEKIDALVDELMYGLPSVKIEGTAKNSGHFATIYFGSNFVAWGEGWDDEVSSRFRHGVDAPVLSAGGFVFYPKHAVSLEEPATNPEQLELF